MSSLNQPHSKQQPVSLTLLGASVILVSFGVMMLLFSVVYVQDIRTLRALPDVVWSFLCGIPVDNGIALPLLLLLSALSFISVALMWAWRRWGGRRGLWLSLVAVLLIGLTGLVLLRGLQSALAAPAPPPQIEGVSYLSAPRTLTDFSLPGAGGAPLSLSNLEGRHTLLFFGYAHCPDICPLTLAEMKRLYGLLGEDAARVQILFVSVDGERDTPAFLSDYLARFDPRFFGMTGDPVVLARLTPEYSLSYSLGQPDASGNYTVEHSTRVYLIDPQRRLTATIAYGTRAEAMAEALRAAWSG
jgi:protein SCO1/2